ncbi:MAG TPA: DEAD/DEAH box helicase, partial [Acidimicrobiaceae bacterium]|nr:DEAD/DEAH box helicase [Acidimicrobiaceae bacterium]
MGDPLVRDRIAGDDDAGDLSVSEFDRRGREGGGWREGGGGRGGGRGGGWREG